jgi:uncharacterized membrane protein
MQEGNHEAQRARQLRMARFTRTLMRHWLAIFVVGYGLFNLLPFVAPIAMRLGLDPVGNAIYAIYSTLCHQMAQRSFFLFGPQPMYNIAQLPVSLSGDTTADMLVLRQFQGNVELGWKVAWSDRMVYLYGSVWLGSALYWLVSRRHHVRRLPVWLFGVAFLPLVIDGGTHFLSDLNGLTAGFRYANVWLADLTNHLLPASFYAGNAFGSFNSWMRLLSGVLAGGAAVWLAFPILDEELRRSLRTLDGKLRRADTLAPAPAQDIPDPLANRVES